MSTNHYEFHPLANHYELLTGENMQPLVDSMRASGFDPAGPVILYQGKILDGRNRYLAACAAEVEPVFAELPEGEDPEEYVVRHNDARRHEQSNVAQQERIARCARMKQARLEGKSLRAIAQAEGVSKSQAERDLKDASSTVPEGGTVEPEGGKVTGLDGRTRTAKPQKPGNQKKLRRPPSKVKLAAQAVGYVNRMVDQLKVREEPFPLGRLKTQTVGDVCRVLSEYLQAQAKRQ